MASVELRPRHPAFPQSSEGFPTQINRRRLEGELAADHAAADEAVAERGAAARKSHAPDVCTFALIEERPFLRECLARSLSSCLTIAVRTFSNIDEALADPSGVEASLIVVSLAHPSEPDARRKLTALFEAHPHLPTIVLAHEEDMNGAMDALGCGAKGYIPVSLGFDLAIEAMRFVHAGGTYVPAECFLVAQRTPAAAAPTFDLHHATSITGRELAVIRALRQGKPNKVIAYELNMCESTVKVHLRHIMKKLKARNRTEVAMKASELVDIDQRPSSPANDCRFQARCAVGTECATIAITPCNAPDL